MRRAAFHLDIPDEGANLLWLRWVVPARVEGWGMNDFSEPFLFETSGQFSSP
jgi:hypothetical protein